MKLELGWRFGRRGKLAVGYEANPEGIRPGFGRGEDRTGSIKLSLGF
jgi:hypothetical protein